MIAAKGFLRYWLWMTAFYINSLAIVSLPSHFRIISYSILFSKIGMPLWLLPSVGLFVTLHYPLNWLMISFLQYWVSGELFQFNLSLGTLRCPDWSSIYIYEGIALSSIYRFQQFDPFFFFSFLFSCVGFLVYCVQPRVWIPASFLFCM